MNRHPMLAKVHIAKKELGLDQEAYRAVLMSAAGKDSAAGMTDRELEAVLTEMQRLGWKAKAGVVRKSDKPHVRKVFALWGELGRRGLLAAAGRSALRAFVRRQTGVDDPEFLTADQSAAVIEALKAMQRRGPK